MASVQPGHSHGDLHDDESLLDDDLIEADDGEYFQGDRISHDTIFPGLYLLTSGAPYSYRCR